MKKAATAEVQPRMSDEAVKAKTGKTWAQWFKLLDGAKATEMNHKEIVAHLSQNHDVGPWWRQMITVTYEQARGLREKHQVAKGYQISVSRTIDVPVGAAFEAWQNATRRRCWLPVSGLTIRKSTPDKSLRITWEDKKSNVEVNLYEKGERKVQVSVQHDKLPDADAAKQFKEYWAAALAKLKDLLEN